MGSNEIVAAILLGIGLVTLILLSAAEAGVVAGVRERTLKEPAENPGEALRRFYQERQITLSSLALARNLASVGVTGVAVYLVLREAGEDWFPLGLTVVATAIVFVLLQGFTRSLVSRNPEAWQRALRPLVATIRFVFRVPVALIDAPIGVILPGTGSGAEELMLAAEMEDASAGLQEEEREMIRGIMELEFTAVREVMVPRTDIVSVEISDTFDALVDTMVGRGYSRIPVYEGDVDHIAGIAHAKEVMRHLRKVNGKPAIRDILRPAHIVPESKKVHELLSEMREKHISIAIVVDEYGGTAGLVTVEDMVEEIVGEINDEFDVEDQPIQEVSDDEAIVDGRVSIDELNELFDMQIEKDDFDSVGGFIVNELGRMPSVGDTVRFNGVKLKVLSVTGRRVKKVQVNKVHEDEQEGEPNE